MYNWSTLLYSRNEQNTVNQLYLNKISFLKRWSRMSKKNIETQRSIVWVIVDPFVIQGMLS